MQQRLWLDTARYKPFVTEFVIEVMKESSIIGSLRIGCYNANQMLSHFDAMALIWAGLYWKSVLLILSAGSTR